MKELKVQIKNTPEIKCVRSKGYNYNFDKKSGYFERYGCTKEDKDDPVMAPMFEILDYEISTECKNNCTFCYKSNTSNGTTIDLSTFKKNLDKIVQINPLLTQIAFGVGSLEYIPHLKNILEYTRSKDVVPNITISCNETNEEGINAIKKLCGACSISNYNLDKTVEMAYKLKNEGSLAQINVHQLLSRETLTHCWSLIKRINKLNQENDNPINAIVFLWIKPCGRAKNHFHPVTQEDLTKLVNYAMENNIGIGFDSCSSTMVSKIPEMEKYQQFIEPCESTLFSAYLDVNGFFHPCSFTTNTQGIHINDVHTINDLWYSPEYTDFRSRLLKNCRSCPTYRLLQ